MNENVAFSGFDEPLENWSKLPHKFIEALPLITSLAELKVVLYVLRHTWGYREYETAKHITTDEFANGRKKKDGTRIDPGIGMSEPSIRSGVKSALEHGFIKVTVDSSDLARIEKAYQLNIHESEGVKSLPSGGKKFTSGGKEVLPRSEKDTLDEKPKKESARKRDPFYDAISETFHLKASGQIVSIKAMMLGNAKKGTWKDCNFEPPVTDAEEINLFGEYMQQRMRGMNITEPISAAVTIQRWFYDYREMIAKADAKKNAAPAEVVDIHTHPELFEDETTRRMRVNLADIEAEAKAEAKAEAQVSA